MAKKKDEITIRSSAAEYLTYVASVGDQQDSIEMRYEDENIWLTQKMMATLYDVGLPTINEHIKKIYADSELEEAATIRNFRIVQTEGSRQVTRDIKHYTRDVYNDNDKIHRNIVFTDTLEVIENIVLFSISNYFLRFSNEFRRIKGDDELDANNW